PVSFSVATPSFDAMSLRVFCGPFTPSLEEAFLARLRELAPVPGRPVAIVAPSRRLAERLERLAAAENGLALLGARFHTFHSLALEALEESGGPSARFVGDGLFHDKVLDRILAAARPSRGLAAAYRSSVRDLIDGGVEPEAFEEHLERLIPEPDDRRKLKALLMIAAEYRRELKSRGILPPSGLAREATEAVQAGRAAGLSRYAELLYYGFYDLTGAQADFFEAVTGAFPCSVFFPHAEGRPGYVFAERFLKVKLGRAKAERLPQGGGKTALGPALDALFAPGAHAAPKKGAFRVFSVSGARDEAWLVAKEILALRAGPNPPEFSELGVVARSLEPYRAAIAEVFADNSIPFWTDAGGPLLRHPAAKLALTLLTLRRREFPSRAVLDVVQSPFCRLREGFEGARDWPLIVRKLGLHSGLSQWEGRLSPWLAKDLPLSGDEEGPKIPAAHVASLWKWLSGLERSLAGPSGLPADPWPAMAAHARSVLEEHFAEPEPGPGRDAWEAALSAIDALAAFGAASPGAGFDDFLETLEEKLRRAELPAAPPNLGVRVLDAMAARGESFEHLFMIGLQERVFPRQVREDPLVPDAVRERLEYPGGYWILPKLAGYGEERLLFTLLAGSAVKTLTCVFPRSGDDGRAQVPSPYLRDLCRATGVELEKAIRVPRRPFEKLAFAGTERLSPKEAALSAAGSSAALRPLGELGLDHILLDGCREKLADLNRAGEPGRFDGVVGEPSKWLEATRREGLSPSALETYLECPFRYFASRLLGLGEVEEPGERGQLSPLERGKLAHSVLEKFHRALLETGFWSRSDGRWEPHLDRALADGLGAKTWRELGVYPLIWEASRARLEGRLRALAAIDVARIRETGLVPSRFEHELEGEVRGIRLHGRADRIDLGPGGRLWIVDYKSGRGPAKLKDKLKSMGALQPPIYLELAIAAGLGPEKAAEGAALYFLEGTKDRPGEPAIVTLGADEWRALRPAFWDNVAGHVARMFRGEFFIAPDEEMYGACERCSFASVCRKSHAPTARRAEGSKLLSDYEKGRELAL
ncbi:MAG: PD-(D/E)XK nuclease family protein, partial [Elusimicrobia bacterium]|nr:PD-(D/E)XK nuclease family protein [Elusimicrobiota bacterium]